MTLSQQAVDFLSRRQPNGKQKDFFDSHADIWDEINHNDLSKLEYIYCSTNGLTELDLSDCAVLETAWCEDNALTSLDVSGCAELRYIYCNGNRLTELDVSANHKLYDLVCYDNALTKLNVTGCAELNYLSCSGNALKEIDLSTVPILFFDLVRAEGNGYVSLRMDYGFDEEAQDYIYWQIAEAKPADGEVFIGWYSESGELISEELELTEFDAGVSRIAARFSGETLIPGDADGSGSVDTTDALLTLRCALGISGNEAEMLASCDMDGSGTIDTTDALIILRMALGIIH